MNNLRTTSESGDKGIAWKIIDLGGVVGTYINGDKVQPNVPTQLKSIGIGCPENKSSKENGKETFVYKLISPQKLVKHENKSDEIEKFAPELIFHELHEFLKNQNSK